mmetsp:Transcript_4616/g.14960  ORF Transcript_4616/g.14960 Transcript_4616/m.14960 type:complete len:484 (+) Transcript_4616:974-2425(+)
MQAHCRPRKKTTSTKVPTVQRVSFVAAHGCCTTPLNPSSSDRKPPRMPSWAYPPSNTTKMGATWSGDDWPKSLDHRATVDPMSRKSTLRKPRPPSSSCSASCESNPAEMTKKSGANLCRHADSAASEVRKSVRRPASDFVMSMGRKKYGASHAATLLMSCGNSPPACALQYQIASSSSASPASRRSRFRANMCSMVPLPACRSMSSTSVRCASPTFFASSMATSALLTKQKPYGDREHDAWWPGGLVAANTMDGRSGVASTRTARCTMAMEAAMACEVPTVRHVSSCRRRCSAIAGVTSGRVPPVASASRKARQTSKWRQATAASPSVGSSTLDKNQVATSLSMYEAAVASAALRKAGFVSRPGDSCSTVSGTTLSDTGALFACRIMVLASFASQRILRGRSGWLSRSLCSRHSCIATSSSTRWHSPPSFFPSTVPRSRSPHFPNPFLPHPLQLTIFCSTFKEYGIEQYRHCAGTGQAVAMCE